MKFKAFSLLFTTSVLINGCTYAPGVDRGNKHVQAYPTSSAIVANGNSVNSRKILFIGNSILYWHDTPRVFARLAAQLKPTEVGYVVGNNYSLRDHWDSGTALNYLCTKGPWDIVVLQDQTNTEFSETIDENVYIRAFIDESLKVKARPLLFQTYVDDLDWAKESNDEFKKLAIQNSVELLPVGKIWSFLRRNYPDIKLYDADNHHPSEAGTYLMAVVVLLNCDERSVDSVLKYSILPAAKTEKNENHTRIIEALIQYFNTPDPLSS